MEREILVVNRKDPALDIYKINKHFEVVDCMRPNELGNPFPVTPECPRDESIKKFRQYLWKKMHSRNDVRTELTRLALLDDITIVLTCCCKPKDCHTDVIKNAILWIRGNLTQYNRMYK